MIKTLKLLNFRRHVDLAFDFTKGLNVIRGANEGGKTTLLEATLYAWYGTSALRSSLAETATWGQPEGSLKVTLEFTFDGVDYTITRSKAGATLRYSDQSVTGQKEVRRFMENLLGATSDVATNLLFADQNAIRGILTQGATAAGSLVETLAELSVIERLVDKIQAQLPYGNTKALMGQTDALKLAASVVVTKPSDTELLAARAAVAGAAAQYEAAVASASSLQLAGQEATTRLAEAVAAEQANRAQDVKAAALKLEIAKTLPEPAVSVEQIVALEAAAANTAEEAFRLAAYNVKFPKADVEWDEGKLAFEARLVELPKLISANGVETHKFELKARGRAAMAVNEKTCAFCKKDLTDVPEVTTLNAAVAKDLEAIAFTVRMLKVEKAQLAEELAAMEALSRVCRQIEKLAPARYWSLSDTVPPVPTWLGAIPTAPEAAVNTKPLRKAWDDYNMWKLSNKLAAETLAGLVWVEVPDTTAARVALAEYGTAVVNKQRCADLQRDALTDQVLCEAVYAAAAARQAAEEASKATAAANLTALQGTIDQMEANNLLVKKLRGAREPIATKLWSTTLHAVSHYFSEVRGVRSLVTRDADGFKIDGHGTANMSGSTLDALGLAIRFALSKMFLPSVPFIFLDEAAAGCDDVRESAMLGTVAAAGFEQVLLVTHSDLGDSLAANLITLS